MGHPCPTTSPPPPGQTVNILETKMQDSVKLHVRVHTALERDSCTSHGPPAGNLPKDIFPHSSLTCSPPSPWPSPHSFPYQSYHQLCLDVRLFAYRQLTQSCVRAQTVLYAAWKHAMTDGEVSNRMASVCLL